jgi:hypothetical protein
MQLLTPCLLPISDPFNNEFASDSAYESDSSNLRRRQRKGCLQLVKEMMDKFMVRGTHSPMQWMLDLLTYGLKIHYNTTARGHVKWVGQDDILYKDMQFNMAQFRGMVHGLATESRRLLMDELLYSGSSAAEPIPSVPWESLRDNPTNERPGWSFFKGPSYAHARQWRAVVVLASRAGHRDQGPVHEAGDAFGH